MGVQCSGQSPFSHHVKLVDVSYWPGGLSRQSRGGTALLDCWEEEEEEEVMVVKAVCAICQ